MNSAGIYVNMINNFAVDFLVDMGAEVTVLLISYAKHICPQYSTRAKRATGVGGDMRQI
jgi:predicted aspartyl protease